MVVRPMRRSEQRPARDVLAAALAEDPAWVHVLPDPRERSLALRCLVGVALADSGSHTRVAMAGGRIVGTAVWQPPGHYPLSAWRQARAVPRLLPMMARLGRRAAAVRRFGDALDAVFPPEPVRYLQILGVAPQAQGGGVGSRLLADGLADADAAGEEVYLETGKPANTAYYERHGFALITPMAALYDGGPAMARMRRPAR